MTKEELCKSMTLQDAIQVFRDTNAYGTMDIAKSVILEALEQKTGHWEWVQYDANPNIGNWHCSKCSCILRGEINGNPIRLPKYCPECGTRMEEKK